MDRGSVSLEVPGFDYPEAFVLLVFARLKQFLTFVAPLAGAFALQQCSLLAIVHYFL